MLEEHGMPKLGELSHEPGKQRDDVMPFPVGNDARRVRSRVLPSQRGLEWRWGILWVAIRRFLMVRGAGAWPVQTAHSPALCLLANRSPLGRTVTCLASLLSANIMPFCARTQKPVCADAYRVRLCMPLPPGTASSHVPLLCRRMALVGHLVGTPR
jgi:hypothetical protein